MSARKAGMAFVSKALSKSLGLVEEMETGPSRPVDEVQMSRRP